MRKQYIFGSNKKVLFWVSVLLLFELLSQSNLAYSGTSPNGKSVSTAIALVLLLLIYIYFRKRVGIEIIDDKTLVFHSWFPIPSLSVPVENIISLTHELKWWGDDGGVLYRVVITYRVEDNSEKRVSFGRNDVDPASLQRLCEDLKTLNRKAAIHNGTHYNYLPSFIRKLLSPPKCTLD